MQTVSNYRYTLTDRLGQIVASPLGESDFTIEWSQDKEEGKRTYKRDFGGKIILTGEAFTRLYRMERTVYRCEYQRVTIEKKCVSLGVATWNEWFSGLISLNEGDWDLDNCRVEIKFQDFKPEQCFLDNKGEKIDLLRETFARRTVMMLPTNIIIETETCEKDARSTGADNPSYLGGYQWCGNEPPQNGAWTAYEHSETDDGIHHRITTKWARQVMELDCIFEPVGVEGWIMVEDNCVVVPGNLPTGSRKYARPATIYGCEYTNGDGTAGSTMVCKIYGQGTDNVAFDNGLPLEDVIQSFVYKFCPEITVKSDFFQINPQEEEIINYVTGKISKVRYLTLYQKSDVKRPNAAGNASKMEWSWDKLMTTLNLMFNVEWRVEGMTLIIEHTSFFKRVKGLDLTQPKYAINVKGKRRYSYTNGTIPKQELWKWKESSAYGDFPGLPIIYDNGCVTRGGRETVKTYAIDDVMTDVEYAVSNAAPDSPNVSDEGIVMIAAAMSGDNYYILTETGILEETRLNNTLALAQLMRDYHRHNRPLRSGRMNGFETSFLSVIPTKKGVPISIPFCCGDAFDPDDIVTTPLGEGIVDKATFKFKSSTLELELLYEANLNLESNKAPVAGNDVLNTDKDVVGYVDILANDSDPDGLVINDLRITTPPQHGTVEILEDKRIKYTPAIGYVGDDYFLYDFADDWNERSNTALVAINVRGNYELPPGSRENVFVKLVSTTGVSSQVVLDCDGVQQVSGTRTSQNYTFYFYSDQAGTIPLDVSGYGLKLNVTFNFRRVHGGVSSVTPAIAEIPGGYSYTYLYNWIDSENYLDCGQNRVTSQNSVYLEKGDTYTRVGEVPVTPPVEEQPPVDQTPMPAPLTILPKLAAPLTGSTRNLPITFGTAVKDNPFGNATYNRITTWEYEEFTPENAGKWGNVQPSQGIYDFSDFDRLMNWARDNGKRVFWHNVIWPTKMKAWFNEVVATMTPTQVMAMIYAHIDKVLDRYVLSGDYPGVLVGVDAVNEPFTGGGNHWDTPIYRKVPNYIPLIVKHINNKAPHLFTFVNEYGQEYGGAGKTNALIALKAICASYNARLDGIGFQMHTVGRVNLQTFRERMQMVVDAGLMIHVSEFDIEMKNGTDPNGVSIPQGEFPFMTPALNAEKTRVVMQMLNDYMALPAWARYGWKTWSLSHGDNYMNFEGHKDYPGLRDFDFKPEPVLLALESRAMELKNLLIYDNFRTGLRANIAGTLTGGTSPKTYTVQGTATGFGVLWVTEKGLQAKTTTNTALVMATVDVGNANFTMVIGLSDILGGEADNTNKNVSGVFRYLDPQNHWFFGPSNSIPGAPWALSKKVSSANTLYVQDTKPAAPNDIAAVICQGNSISLYVNGALVGTATHADLNTRTKAGLKFKNNVDTVSAVDFWAVGI